MVMNANRSVSLLNTDVTRAGPVSRSEDTRDWLATFDTLQLAMFTCTKPIRYRDMNLDQEY